MTAQPRTITPRSWMKLIIFIKLKYLLSKTLMYTLKMEPIPNRSITILSITKRDFSQPTLYITG